MAGTKAPIVLIADDDVDVLKLVQFHVDRLGCKALTARDKGELLRVLDENRPTLLLLDVRFGESDGVEILRDILKSRPKLAIVMLTAFGSIESAVTAIKLGARDYLSKPPDWTRLKVLIDDAINELEAESSPPPAVPANSPLPPNQLIGSTPAMVHLKEVIAHVGPTDASVLILGESGTGKEVVARAVRDASKRANKPFIALNMAALPRELVESTLFGHERGPFTGADQAQTGAVEAADGGTLFLDEIGEMDINLQAKLLRFLQERAFHRVGSSKLRSVDVRIIAATNRNPLEQVAKGLLREDLYYRLNVVPVSLPPLRERADDIPALVDHFLHRAVARYGKPIEGFTPAAMMLLKSARWPGNIRQLENTIERVVIFSKSNMIDTESIPSDVLDSPTAVIYEAEEPTSAVLRPMEEMEKLAIIDALSRSGGQVREAARLLGLGQATVYRKIKRFGIVTD